MKVFKTIRKAGEVLHSEVVDNVKIEVIKPDVKTEIALKDKLMKAGDTKENYYSSILELISAYVRIDGKKMNALEIAEKISDEFISYLAGKVNEIIDKEKKS